MENLSEWVVRRPSEVQQLLRRGSAVRATGATRANEASSRSHAVFIIVLEQVCTLQPLQPLHRRTAAPLRRRTAATSSWREAVWPCGCAPLQAHLSTRTHAPRATRHAPRAVRRARR